MKKDWWPLIIMVLLVGFYSWIAKTHPDPTPDTLQRIEILKIEIAETKKYLEQTINITENGIDYIIKNSNLNKKEASKVFYLCVEKSQKYHIPLELLLNVCRVESHFNQSEIGNAGERGIMQILPQTAKHLCKELGLIYHKNKLFDLEFNIELGTSFLNQLHKRYGNWNATLSHYNSGNEKNRAYLKRLKEE